MSITPALRKKPGQNKSLSEASLRCTWTRIKKTKTLLINSIHHNYSGLYRQRKEENLRRRSTGSKAWSRVCEKLWAEWSRPGASWLAQDQQASGIRVLETMAICKLTGHFIFGWLTVALSARSLKIFAFPSSCLFAHIDCSGWGAGVGWAGVSAHPTTRIKSCARLYKNHWVIRPILDPHYYVRRVANSKLLTKVHGWVSSSAVKSKPGLEELLGLIYSTRTHARMQN